MSSRRISPLTVIVGAAALIALALAAGFVYVQFFAPAGPGEIEQLTIDQNGESPLTITSASTIREFEAILEENEIDLRTYETQAACDDAETSNIVVTYGDERETTLTTHACGDDLDFSSAITAFVDEQLNPTE
jgi:hypothetical protein